MPYFRRPGHIYELKIFEIREVNYKLKWYIEGYHCLIISVTVLLEYINLIYSFHTEAPSEAQTVCMCIKLRIIWLQLIKFN